MITQNLIPQPKSDDQFIKPLSFHISQLFPLKKIKQWNLSLQTTINYNLIMEYREDGVIDMIKNEIDKERTVRNDSAYQCTYSECGKKFDRSSTFTKHIEVHQGKRPYACSTCQSSFTDRSNLLRHQRLIHARMKPFSCNVCNKNFSTKSNLSQHQVIHGPRQPLECPIKGCQKSFLYKSNLRKHTSNHSKRSCGDCPSSEEEQSCVKCNQPLVCSISDCRQEFMLEQLKQAHQKDHQKQYKCDNCKRRFSTQFNLKKHTETHEQWRKTYSCQLQDCRKRFLHKSSLKKHRMKHGDSILMPGQQQQDDFHEDNSTQKIDQLNEFDYYL